MTRYTGADLELAQHWSAQTAYDHPEALAQLIADVRQETREATIRECIAVADCDAGYVDVILARLEALLKPPSAPAEPKCKVCGELREAGDHFTTGHPFEPDHG